MRRENCGCVSVVEDKQVWRLGSILSRRISTQNHRPEHSRQAKNMCILSSSSRFLLPGTVGLPINSLFLLNFTHFNRTFLIYVVLETPTDKHTSSESVRMYLRINTLPRWSSLFCGLVLWLKSLTLIEVVRVHSWNNRNVFIYKKDLFGGRAKFYLNLLKCCLLDLGRSFPFRIQLYS